MRLLVPYHYIEISMKGGIEQATFEMLNSMLPNLDALILVRDSNFDSSLLQKLQSHPKVSIVYFSNRAPTLIARVLRRWHRWKREKFRSRKLYWNLSDTQELRAIIDNFGATHCLYFFTRFQKPPQISIPLFGVIHDLWWHTMPASETLIDREDYCLKTWIKAATHLICISDNTREEVLTLHPESAEKVVSIPLGLTIPAPSKAIAKPSNDSGITHFYYPAQFKANKRHIDLLEAALKMARMGLEFKITFTGQDTEKIVADSPIDNQQLEACRLIYSNNRSLLADHIVVLGFTSREAVESLYRNCHAIVLTSIYEGFGLPLTEGISRGSPVICTDIAVFREQATRYQFEDWVRYFESGNVEQLTTILSNFIQYPIPRIEPDLIPHRLSRWTWKDTADAYLRLLQPTKP